MTIRDFFSRVRVLEAGGIHIPFSAAGEHDKQLRKERRIMSQVKLGQLVRDPITSPRGIAIARTEWLYGCVRIGVSPQELKDGKPVEEVWFDEARLEVLEEEPIFPRKPRTVEPESAQTDAPGGPERESDRRSNPTR